MIACTANGRGIVETASKVGADIVFPTMLPLGQSPIPRVGYLFDFQHRHMPDLFSARIRRNRDLRFERIAKDSNAVIVNSRAAANDASIFLGIPDNRILTIPYTPYAREWWFETDPLDARRRHGIGPHYLAVCNHFWKHKDHATALRAFAMLRKLRPDLDLQLLLTGDPIDHRDPRHYGELITLSESLGIARYSHFLGLIPKRDQLALLRGCLALIQPTRFEGGPGGGSVYEAIGLGVPCVVSDIPVNLEIDQGDVVFFRTGDAADLAGKVAKVLSSQQPQPARDALLANGDRNLARLGSAICDYLAHIPSMS